VDERQRLAVHLVGDDRVGVHGLGHRHLTDEGGHRAERPVAAVHDDVPRRVAHTGFRQDVGQPCAGPARVADGAALPLDAGHRGLEERAAVARAFERHRDGGTRHRLERLERQRERGPDEAVHLQRQILHERQRWRGHVRPHVELIVRRDPRIEQPDRRLVVGRARRADDEARVLAVD